jgi:hypothetical protein
VLGICSLRLNVFRQNSLRPERDPIATSSSDFSHGRIKKLKDPHLHALPVEAWYFGTKRFPDKSATDSPLYWLLWEGTSTLIVKQGPLGPLSKLHVNFLLDRQVQSLQVCS